VLHALNYLTRKLRVILAAANVHGEEDQIYVVLLHHAVG
jgi:hypothetical protein